MTVPGLNQVQYEYDAWQQVVTLLRKTKAVTDADLEASPLAEPTTAGMQLIQAINHWGEELAKLRQTQPLVLRRKVQR
jgi:hypothetical protein